MGDFLGAILVVVCLTGFDAGGCGFHTPPFVSMEACQIAKGALKAAPPVELPIPTTEAERQVVNSLRILLMQQGMARAGLIAECMDLSWEPKVAAQ